MSAGAVGSDDVTVVQSRGGDDGPGDDNGGDRARDREVRHAGTCTVERLIGDSAGADAVTGVARNAGTGETCTARVVLPA